MIDMWQLKLGLNYLTKFGGGAGKIWGAVPPGPNVEPQLDRAITIGCRLSVVCNVLYCDETIRPSEKLSRKTV